MALLDVDLAWIRDEIGTTTPPADGALEEMWDELGHRILVSLRVLKRRRAGLAGGGVQSVSIPGAVAVSLRSDLASLDRQIDRLQKAYEAETGVDLPDTAQATSTTLRRRVSR